MFTDVFAKSMIAVLSAVAGAGLLFFIKLEHRKLCALISFSAGALLGAAVFTLIPESSHSLSFIEVAGGVLSGYLLFWLITKYYSHVCPACSASHFDEQTTHKFSEIVLTLLTALSIHSLLDGMAISAGGLDTGKAHESIFIAIAIHKFPEGLALAALMFSSGYKKSKIIVYVTLVELVTVIGGLLGVFFFAEGFPASVMGIVMAHVAGGFVFLAYHAVAGEMLKHHTKLVLSTFISGLLLIFSVFLYIG